MALRRRTDQLDQPLISGGDQPFPKGTWQFEVEETRTRPTPDFFAKSRGDSEPRCASEDSEILQIQLGNAAAIDAHGEAGNRKHFIEFVIRDGSKSIFDVDPDKPNGEGWMIRRDSNRLFQLAGAMGQLIETDDGYAEVNPEFIDLLKNGELKGASIGVEITHGRPYKKQDGTTRVDAMEKRFFAV